MRDIKESVVESLDGTSHEIFHYLPYILQDLREIGTDPITVSELLHDFAEDEIPLKILDLGCGKGAVSVRLAKDYNCMVYGIDALPEFVESAKEFAIENGVYHNCVFSQGDIRDQYAFYHDFDVIILGAIGPVLGNVGETLKKVSGCLKSTGFVILDDGYIPDNSEFKHEKCNSQSEFLCQIKSSGFEIVSENIFSYDEMLIQNEAIYTAIKSRTAELVKMYPEKAELFEEYLLNQERENEALENHLVCGVWLLGKS